MPELLKAILISHGGLGGLAFATHSAIQRLLAKHKAAVSEQDESATHHQQGYQTGTKHPAKWLSSLKKTHGEVVFVLLTMANIRSEGKLCSDIHTLEREQVTIDQGKAKKLLSCI
jgi:hypothetical protein